MGKELKATPPMNVTPIDVLPKPLKEVREQAKQQLSNILGDMFDNADDALFELADKAGSNADQTMYFDSMREVRIKRQSMEGAFSQALQDGFRSLFQLDDKASQKNLLEEIEADSLTLVQDDELEESVAIRGMISKVMSRHDVEVEQLSSSIDSLVTVKTITDLNNPIAPQNICLAFQQASTLLELNIRAKLVVYKLFDKFVLGEIGQVYEAANSTLANLGIKPTPKSRPTAGKIKASKVSEQSQNQVATQQSESEEQEEVFNFLRELLNESREEVVPASNTINVAEQGPSLSNQDLVQLLSSIQEQRTQSENLANVSTQPLDVKHALSNLISTQKNLPTQAIGRVDDDVINLVSMLFEFILDDRHLPTPMKALLARLQIPMLKVAILDNTFFSRGGHPARRLLNELSTAAMGWNEAVDVARDPLYKKVEWVVETVLNDFVDNLDLFQSLQEEFTAFVSTERRRAELIEQRTRDAEEGLGKSQRAKAIVGKTLNEIAQGKKLSPIVIELLRDGWSNYMFLIHVKEGVESLAWLDAVGVVEDLIWSVQRQKDSDHRSALLKMIPSLLQRLRKGLSEISFNKTKMRTLLKELEAIHLSCLKTGVSRPVGTKINVAPVKQVAPKPVEKTSNAKLTEATSNIDQPEEPKIETDVAVESPQIIENVDMDVVDVDNHDEAQDEYAQVIGNLSVGAWVEIFESDENKYRAKLAAIIRATGKYIFVNRVGMKIAEKTRPELANDIQTGTINVLDNAMLFDRALESVIGHLREMKD